MARGVQMPWEQGHSAIVMRGREGVGKSFLAKMYGALFGVHYLSVSNAKHIVGQFTGHLSNIVFLFGDEAFNVGDSQHEATLKSMITENRSMFEKKGVDARAGVNCLKLMLASNEKWVVPAGMNDRRFLVLDVGDNVMQNSKYFGAIQKEMDNGGYEAMLYDLLHRDISRFNVREIPQTEALMDQKVHGLKPAEEWIYHCLCEGQIIPGKDWEGPHPNDTMTYYARGFGNNITSTAVGRLLKDLGFELSRCQLKTEVLDVRGHASMRDKVLCKVLRPIEECRALFQARRGIKIDVREYDKQDPVTDFEDDF
jgi:hypothetical protein